MNYRDFYNNLGQRMNVAAGLFCLSAVGYFGNPAPPKTDEARDFIRKNFVNVDDSTFVTVDQDLEGIRTSTMMRPLGPKADDAYMTVSYKAVENNGDDITQISEVTVMAFAVTDEKAEICQSVAAMRDLKNPQHWEILRTYDGGVDNFSQTREESVPEENLVPTIQRHILTLTPHTQLALNQ